MVDIVARDLSFRYPGAQAATLEALSFEVASNSTLALLGSSGAGKTTLLKLLSGLLPRAQGSLAFDGKEVLGLPAGERGVSQVFQFPVLYESLSVLDNIAFPLRALGFGKRERTDRARAIAELLEIDDWLLERPAKLALFQAQIAGFAKALVRPDTALVLLDEPLTAVEPALKWRLRGLLKRAQEELQISMIYVTHDQTEALTIADRVSVLHNGSILQTGTAAELYNTPQHVEVARFIGSPGMNMVAAKLHGGVLQIAATADRSQRQQPLLDAAAQALADGPVVVGFRPEWARAEPGQQTRVSGVRVIGADNGATQGYLELTLNGERVQLHQALTDKALTPGAGADILLQRALLFRNDRLVGAMVAR